MLVLAGAAAARAQEEEEETAGDARAGYAWGEGRAPEPEDPLRVMGFIGAGIGLRPLRNLDPPFYHDLPTPPYLDFGAAVFAPGGDLRHGGGLTITTNLASDVDANQDARVPAGNQWVFTPSYHLLVPLRRLLPDLGQDWLSLQGRIGLPLAITSYPNTVAFSFGGELALSVIFKFLAGLGAYLELTGAIYGGTNDTVHPILSADLGLLFDYEVLP